ncbi:hypothetical protein Tco_1500941 [Tanacetum coccineum]
MRRRGGGDGADDEVVRGVEAWWLARGGGGEEMGRWSAVAAGGAEGENGAWPRKCMGLPTWPGIDVIPCHVGLLEEGIRLALDLGLDNGLGPVFDIELDCVFDLELYIRLRFGLIQILMGCPGPINGYGLAH